MLPELLGKLLWGTGKLAVKYVVVPVAITAAAAYALKEVVRRLDEKPLNGHQARLDPIMRPSV